MKGTSAILARVIEDLSTAITMMEAGVDAYPGRPLSQLYVARAVIKKIHADLPSTKELKTAAQRVQEHRKNKREEAKG